MIEFAEIEHQLDHSRSQSMLAVLDSSERYSKENMVVPTPVYSNAVSITAGPFDVVMDFRAKTPGDSNQEEQVAVITMSIAHAKTLIPVLSQVVAEYEKAWGTVPAPGFEPRTPREDGPF